MDESHLFATILGPLPKKEIISLADTILTGEKQTLPVNIIFADDVMLEKLNREFRGKDCPTDVLSFAADPELEILGEIYISMDTARRQAEEYGATLPEELLRLVCHGVLHLCGFDHHEPDDAVVMQGREKEYLSGYMNHV